MPKNDDLEASNFEASAPKTDGARGGAPRASAPKKSAPEPGVEASRTTGSESTKGRRGSLPLSMAILLISAFIGNFTQTQLSTALPQLVDDFGISLTMGQWVTSVFMLTLGVMVPMTAFLTKRFTTRQITIVCLSIFVLGSLVAYFSTNFLLLIVGRILQAAGTGILLPCLQIIIFSQLPAGKRGSMMGMIGLVLAAAPAVGPTLGGWQTDVFGWRSIFLLLTVLGVILLVITIFFMGSYGRREDTSIDFISVILSTLGFGGLLFGFTNVEQYPVSNPLVWAPMLVGVVCLAWFVRRQQNLKRKDQKPLLNLAVLKVRNFTIGTLAISLNFFAFSAFTVLIPIYLQTYRGMEATLSGLVTLPGALLSACTGLIAGRFFDRIGAHKLCVTGAALMLVGAVMSLPLTMETPVVYLTVAQAVRMAGIGLVMTTCNTWALASLPSHLINDGTAVTNTLRQCVGAIGAPVIVVLTESIEGYLAGTGVSSTLAGVIGSRWGIGFATFFYVILLLVAIFWVRNKKHNLVQELDLE